MTSGIYLLTFGDDEYVYVGKSVDVENRWRQHFSKFEKRTAAKNMLLAFDQYGYPTTSVIIESHPDHLDILEPIYIESFKNTYGLKCLNSSMPEIYHRPTQAQLDLLEYDDEIFTHSTFEHIDQINTLVQKVEDRNAVISNLGFEVSDLKLLNQELTEKLADYPNTIDLGVEGNKWRSEYQREQHLRLKLQYELKNAILQLQQERQKSWWTKLWQ